MSILSHLRKWFRRSAKAGPLEILPKPLLIRDHDLVVVWSAKSACTTVMVWFAGVSGFLPDLRASGRSPHDYRRHVFYKSSAYRDALARPLDGRTLLHVARDPYARAVSSYRHALRTGYEDERFAESPIGPLDRHAGFSFVRFLDYLESIDITEGNVHHRPQWHPVEQGRRPDIVIDIARQNLFDELNRVARLMNLPETDFAALDFLHRLEGRRAAKPVALPGDDLSDVAFDRLAAAGRKPWPHNDQLLSDPVRRRIRQLYAVDFENLAPRG